jgi:hypothetical protein
MVDWMVLLMVDLTVETTAEKLVNQMVAVTAAWKVEKRDKHLVEWWVSMMADLLAGKSELQTAA